MPPPRIAIFFFKFVLSGCLLLFSLRLLTDLSQTRCCRHTGSRPYDEKRLQTEPAHALLAVRTQKKACALRQQGGRHYGFSREAARRSPLISGEFPLPGRPTRCGLELYGSFLTHVNRECDAQYAASHRANSPISASGSLALVSSSTWLIISQLVRITVNYQCRPDTGSPRWNSLTPLWNAHTGTDQRSAACH